MRQFLFQFFLLAFVPALALAHPETGFLPDAIAEVEYKMVVEINPRDTVTRNKLGIVLYRKNKLQEAEYQFKEILKLAPQDFDAHDGLGLVKLKQRNFPAAQFWFQKAISLSAKDTMVRYNLGFVYEQTGRYQEAATAYRQALAVNEQNLRGEKNKELEAGKRKIIEAALLGLTSKLKKTATGRK